MKIEYHNMFSNFIFHGQWFLIHVSCDHAQIEKKQVFSTLRIGDGPIGGIITYK